ncbi:zf-MYND domain containing protein [Pyrenophora tritici-repentis]|uniref:MYND finger n=2 Tax=Pyrenophora tritici-repentis TaxID=45151 RepID=A0A2W1GWH5_9PLEO|nr:uncharacterized protein PTRG_08877 [Pyrenophora tritici-repentis Pt-1C-BFP]KAA8627454.1 zf-MYND multi-domain protein [Pyrenophora tritici-repentis]EDU41928.1 predicted protein [Pyrenophora tritici-repentis Pt-1C-BFP]KAF7442513.1 zf-MYND multi-domain protein [Pyrenophora tritici-repentis]KAF7579110.1 zf-MYND multi-domain protein [Pyrenophora tritici-repentis]KAG9378041.1 zf-MYND multi-domain protein [Pyrenophora tritici-repentis]
MSDSEEPLDLYDIGVLMTYERNTTEPQLRHTKLREVAFPGNQPKTVALNSPIEQGWNKNACTWIIVEEENPRNPSAPDLPQDFLQEDKRAGSTFSDEQLETLFYQARNHDGCYKAIGLLQLFFGLFPDDTKLRVRHAPLNKQPGESYITTINRRVIIEEAFREPKLTTAIVSLPEGTLQVSGHQPLLPHAVVGFSPHDSATVKTFFDLSSMQFGDLGRGPGPKGKQLFALDTPEEFAIRFSHLARGADPSQSQHTLAISGTPFDDWLLEVAIRVKKRWDNKDKEKWCGHCGAPKPVSKCSGCGQVYYCGKQHQKLAWGFHRGYCAKA